MEGASRGSSASEEEYAKFLEKVRRTIYMDSLSFKVTKAMILAALDQLGTVVDVQFIQDYSGLVTSQCVLVEMGTEKDAKSIIQMSGEVPIMIGGMPRPVRVEPAEPEMFADRPAPSGRKIVCRWVEPGDPDFVSAKICHGIIKRHAREAGMLMQLQLEVEEKLHKKQNETLKEKFKIYETMEGTKGSAKKLAYLYGHKLDWYD